VGWLEDALRNYSQARQKLNQQDDPDAPALVSPEQAADPQDALTLLVQGYQKYLKRSGRQEDPLAGYQTRSRSRGDSTLVDEVAPGRLVPGADGEAFRVTSHGPRAGMVHQRYELGKGRFANVYYDPKTGRRQVYRFRSPRS
jgi:hypothetical protein